MSEKQKIFCDVKYCHFIDLVEHWHTDEYTISFNLFTYLNWQKEQDLKEDP